MTEPGGRETNGIHVVISRQEDLNTPERENKIRFQITTSLLALRILRSPDQEESAQAFVQAVWAKEPRWGVASPTDLAWNERLDRLIPIGDYYNLTQDAIPSPRYYHVETGGPWGTTKPDISQIVLSLYFPKFYFLPESSSLYLPVLRVPRFATKRGVQLHEMIQSTFEWAVSIPRLIGILKEIRNVTQVEKDGLYSQLAEYLPPLSQDELAHFIRTRSEIYFGTNRSSGKTKIVVGPSED